MDVHNSSVEELSSSIVSSSQTMLWNIALCAGHIIFSSLVVILCIFYKQLHAHQLRVTFGHHGRTLLTLCLTVVLLLVTIEGILCSLQQFQWILDFHCANVLGVFSAALSLVLCEVLNVDILVGILLGVYWLACSILHLLLVISLTSTGLPISDTSDVHFLLSLFSVVLYACLCLLQSYAFVHKRLFPDAVDLCSKGNDFLSLKYIHSHAPLLSKILLHWLNNLLTIGFQRSICLEDLGKIPQEECSSVNFYELKEAFEREKTLSFEKNRAPSLWRCLWHLSCPTMFLSGLFKLCADFLVYIPPISLDLIVTYVGTLPDNSGNINNISGDNSRNINSTLSSVSFRHQGIKEFFTNGYVVCYVCFIALLLQFIFTQHNFFICIRQGIRCKAAIQAAVYDKSLHLLTSIVNEGQIVNHLTVDTIHLVMFFNFAHYIWTLPIQIVTGFLVLYAQLGKSALISSVVIMLVVPVQYFLALRLGIHQKQIMDQSDERLKKSNELLQSIKLLKLYAWEKLFYRSVHFARKQELNRMLKAAVIRVFSATFTDGVPCVACLMTFVLYNRLESEPLTAGKVFSGIALFSNFASQLFIITLVINIASQACVSVARLREFLLLPELKKPAFICDGEDIRSSPMVVFPSNVDSVLFAKCHRGDLDVLQPLKSLSAEYLAAGDPHISATDSPLSAVQIVSGWFTWNTEPNLTNINLTVPVGKMTMVVGPIGSGKSSLLYAMLGEMKQLSGSLSCCSRSVAIVPQSCWILNATVRENILFGNALDLERYSEVLEVTGLQPDLKQFTNGDETEIGEKGATLSGGQRQRIAIARALYAEADILFLDDCLSALDAVVGAHVFNEAILRLLLMKRQKTVVFVTHNIHLLSQADHLVALKKQEIVYEGSVNSLMSQNPELYAIFIETLNNGGNDRAATHQSHSSLQAQSRPPDLLDDTMLSHLLSCKSSARSLTSLTSLTTPADNDVFVEKMPHADVVGATAAAEAGKLIEEEEHATGSVSVAIYLSYFKAAMWVTAVSTLVTFMLWQVLRMAADYVLADMVHTGAQMSSSSNSTVKEILFGEYKHYMMLYIILCGLCVVCTPLSIFCLELMALTASKNIHHSVLQNIVAAPLQYFDRTPVGRILNRLSADMSIIDEKLTGSFETLLFCSFNVIGGIVLSCYVIPLFIIAVVPVIIFFVIIQRFFIASCRELQRLDCITRSPILAHVSQTLAGLSTIRAFRSEQRFMDQMCTKIDSNQLPFLFYHTTNIWMGIRLDMLGALIVLASSLSALTSGSLGYIDSGLVGLVIAYSIMLSAFLNWMMRGISETEIYFNSVDRVIQYSNLESEPNIIGSEARLDADWPSCGEVKFKAVSLKYNVKQEAVVKNVSLCVSPGLKVGICGRTGSGKSSMTMSLFRAVHISHGEITLDGVDITQVPLHKLRSKLSIIPQEPVLFSGTLRFNLDPLSISADDQLWHVLRIAQLEELVTHLPNKLDTVVTEGGVNFSSGQRQLFCLARALLRKSKVLVMDEATASIDIETDRIIQSIVQQAFRECTVFVIAHRISTIQNCDCVIVLSDGCIIEKGTPSELSALTNGEFAKMLADNHL